jgi:RNA polymerase sigma factor (sigma-70 family)
VAKTDPSIKRYLNEIGRYPLLRPEEEIELGRRVARLNELEARETLDTSEEIEVVICRKAKQKFINCNLRLVVNVATKYHHMCKTLELTDLIQDGNLALIRAVEKFDFSRGYKFSTYCYWWIRQAMQRSVKLSDSSIRLPTSFHDLLGKINKAVEELTKEFDCRPTFKEISDHVGISVEELIAALQRAQPLSSLDTRVEGEEGQFSIGERMEDLVNINTVESLEIDTMLEELFFALENYLDDLTRYVVIERSRETPTTWKDLQDATGLSRHQLQEIEREGMEKCKLTIEAQRGIGIAFDP